MGLHTKGCLLTVSDKCQAGVEIADEYCSSDYNCKKFCNIGPETVAAFLNAT